MILSRKQAERVLIEYERAILSTSRPDGLDGWGDVEDYGTLRGVVTRILAGEATERDGLIALKVGDTPLMEYAGAKHL